MENSTRRKHVAWIEATLAHLGVTQTDLARRAGVDPSTLSRFLREVNPGSKLNSETIERIALISPIPPFETIAPHPMRGLSEEEAEPYQPTSRQDFVSVAVDQARKGRNGVDPWVLSSEALVDAGYMPGDILIVDLNAEPTEGDIVCAQVYDNAGRAHTVFRIYEEPYLVAASKDPKLRRPLHLGKDRVLVKGAVIATLRMRPRAA